MAIITKIVLVVALVCMVSALPVENGQEQEAKVDLLSVDDIPQQDVGSAAVDGQVRDKRHGFYGGFGVPVVSIGYGGFGGGYGYGYPVYGGYGGYGGYGYGHRHHHHHGGYYGGYWG